MFQLGDQICYPMHGVGVVEAIEERTVLGKQAQYYVLRFVVGKMTALVPVESAEQVGLRAIIPTNECDGVLRYLRQEPCRESENWNQRYRDNYAKLRGGNIYDVADVVKCLKRRDSEKGLSAGERKMLLTAWQVLCAELCTASGCGEDELSCIVGG
ncbi:MAG TPA: CarD family transcriptional regulator [Clostridia bacterium]|nr:CarD family transcriptional regulator [Clostridia bacterium]